MLTKNEITTLSLSPTKKDFVQIWNELLEVAGKLSERWDPTSTNESDPGIVILKALTGIADKLNYNIDKNTLEAFMPTAAQEDSMRKLCEMLGYNIKYYRSAETTVTIKWYNADPTEDEQTALDNGLLIPKFTVVTNSDQDINYFIIDDPNYPTPAFISSTTPVVTFKCLEGQIVKCESTSDNNVITASQISENNRFYLPEAQIAENGIFVYNVAANGEDGTAWKKVDNLNIQARGERVFKFGYDSYEGRPYIEFPEDYSSLIRDGLYIYYARTSGANGNISNSVLTQLELPSAPNWDKVSIESFSVNNSFAATTGANLETINQAYNNFKKTIGTFETLVTCRDYMNKIYTMTNDENGKPLVSNILATDIRTDLNRAVTICSCDDAGIFYKDTPIRTTLSLGDTTKPRFDNGWYIGTTRIENFINDDYGFDYKKGADVSIDNNGEFWAVTQNGVTYKTGIPAAHNMSAIDHFDLVLYPFKSYNQIKGNVLNIQDVYDSSFTYSGASSFKGLKDKLDNSDIKTIAHTIKSPNIGDIICINNYLRLNAIIGTNSKITSEEGTLLIEKIKIALANAFNMRELDFGEEIPFESIVDVIKNADARINVVSMTEPALYTTFSVFEGVDIDKAVVKEYAVASDWLSETEAKATGRFSYTDSDKKYTETFNTEQAKRIYNKLAVRNILAGRVPLFKYNTIFKHSFSDAPYKVTDVLKIKPDVDIAEPTESNPITTSVINDIIYTGQYINGDIKYTKTYTPEQFATGLIEKAAGDDTNFTEITTNCKIRTDKNDQGQPTNNISDVTLGNGEFVKFKAPNFTTKKTYPAYVNYHLDLTTKHLVEANPAKAYSLYNLLNTDTIATISTTADTRRQAVLDYFDSANLKKTFKLTQKVAKKVEGESTTGGSLVIENPSSVSSEDTPVQILHKSGFVKITSLDATLAWDCAAEESPAEESPAVSIPSLDLGDSQFIVSASVFNSIQNAVDNFLKNSTSLPSDCDWTISYSFEYVPFESTTLSTWASFINTNGKAAFGFIPKDESGTILWRAYEGGYPVGKYIIANTTSKLMPFTNGHFGLLDSLTSRLAGIYIAEDFGRDVEANFISNNEEYELRNGEYLYIEYTPSTTTEDGTSQTQESVKEILGPGTIIKPSGFDSRLVDSTAYKETATAPKTVKFDTIMAEIPMYSLGASEQIEVREFAKVELNNSTLSNASKIYVYKNFNGCTALETIPSSGSGVHTNSTYVLKDGEYIFYTDQNKAELAYFSSGTEVTLTGNTYLPQFETIDLATILSSSIQDIPWKPLELTGNNGIIFKEFQYITLGNGDTIKNLQLVDSREYLDSQWRSCANAVYTLAGEDTQNVLPKINVTSSEEAGNGWEACSILELKASPSTSQAIRVTDKLETSITLCKTTTGGELAQEGNVEIAFNNIEFDENVVDYRLTPSPLSFKTNLVCNSSNNQIKISELYTNTENVSSFALKVFTEETPTIVKTRKNTLIPYYANGTITDMSKWPWAADVVQKGTGELWNRVALINLISDDIDNVDYALRLPVSLLPNTYGIFSIYLHYDDNTYVSAENPTNAQTWLELPEGHEDDVTILNVAANEVISDQSGKYKKIFLKPGINCIKVAKTMDIFVKTNSGASSTCAIYFDELSLVDYTDAGPFGLNLGQLGYLAIANTDDTDTGDTDTTDITADTDETLETQLLNDIRSIDKDRDFYWNVPVEANVAIDFNEGVDALNTLMNPAINYDINNVNNNFVISKLDINYLTNGIQIARSSRLS